MKKKYLVLLLLLPLFIILTFSHCGKNDDGNNNPNAELALVSKDPKKKIVILEEFTGVRCPYCPAGHEVINNILAKYPNKVFAISYHPSNSSLTEPYSGDEDFRRDIINDLFESSFAGKRFMPGAFIVRRKGMDGNRLQGRDIWMEACGGVSNEDSPLNVGLTSSYDASSGKLEVIVQIYFVEDVNDPLFLYVMLSESGLISTQAGAGEDYVQNHVFREILNTSSPWGQPITESTLKGSKITRTITFMNTGNKYKMSNCEILAFVRNGNNEEIISGNGAKVGENSPW